MEEIILGLIAQYPKAAAVLAVMGLLRAIFKPIMAAVESYIADSASTKDDAKLAKLKAHKAYKAFAWLLDYTASIKLPKEKK